MKKIILLFVCNLFLTNGYSQFKTKAELFKEGTKYYQEKKLIKAEVIFKEMIRLDSIDKNSYFNLGAIYLEKSERENAIFNFVKCVELGDEEAFKTLREKLNYNYEYFNLNKIASYKILHEIGIKLLEKNMIQNAEKYFLRAAKFGDKKSSELLVTKYKYKTNDVTFYNLEELDSYPFYIHKGKHYKAYKRRGEIKLFKKINKLILKDEKLKNLNLKSNSNIYLNINSKGKIVPIFQNIPKEIRDRYEEMLINNFKFIPAKINEVNVGVVGYWDRLN
ncbi:MAG: hypothetical protein COA88_07340 [Kordia sp.]|nr:MAG: hypothetical protein COA88_07340 [Kordia sp.]